MKKIISLLVTAVLLLSVFSVCANAAGSELPQPTSGPADGKQPYLGGARIGTYDKTIQANVYVVRYTDSLQIDNDAIPGASYDLASNTLTLTNVSMPDNYLFIWYMGDDFKLNIVGECELGMIYVSNEANFHSTSLNIVGTGTLTVNQKEDFDNGIRMYSDGDNSVMHLDIADSVTVHCYGMKAPEFMQSSDPYFPAVTLVGTRLNTADQAMTADGAAIPEAQVERIEYDEADQINVAILWNPEKEYDHGVRIQSKSDPEGLYSLEIWENNEEPYAVHRFIYYPEANITAPDYSFGDNFSSFRCMTKEQFEEEYTVVQGLQPKPVKFTTDEAEQNRGWVGVKMGNTNDPDAVYAGSAYWNEDDEWGSEPPSGYYIYRLYWDEEQKFYVEDPEFETEYLSLEEVFEQGYYYVFEEVYDKVTLPCWMLPIGSEDNWNNDLKVLDRASDPDNIYVQSGTYTSGNKGDADYEEGITVRRVHYDPVAEEHYIDIYDYTEGEYFYIPYAELESDSCEFTYKYDTFERRMEIRFIDEDYDFDDYCYHATLLTKDNDPDTIYAYEFWNSAGNGSERYSLVKLEWREDKGHYYQVGESLGTYSSLDEITAQGYSVVMEDQPVPFTVMGRASFNEDDLYLDDSGNKYIVDYDDTVYRVDESKELVMGEETYYPAEKCDVDAATLQDTFHHVVTDSYRYFIPGPAYHHIGAGGGEGFTVSGSFTSYLNKPGVTIELLQNGEQIDSVGYQDDTGNYSFTNVAAGNYILRVSKTNHATRDYAITVSGDTTQNVKICPMGDVSGDGKVTTKDSSMAFQKVQGKLDLDAYQIKCGDVVKNDNKITSNDVSRIFQHAQGKSSLW